MNHQQLSAGIKRLGLDIGEARQETLLAYLGLMAKWNQVYNLTSRRDESDWVPRHLLDSLAVLPYINGSRIADIGSGAGVPGIVLAIASPERQFTLLDSNAKKARFMTQAAIELKLDNVTVISGRAEAFMPQTGFDSVISRAFAAVGDFLRVAGHLAAPEGKLLAMKGVYPEDELADVPAGFQLESTERLDVPFLEGERHLLIFKRVNN